MPSRWALCAILVVCLAGMPAVADAKTPRTRIASMKMKLRGSTPPGSDYIVTVAVRLRVCGQAGNVVLRVTETLSPPRHNHPVWARAHRDVHRSQGSRCDSHRFTFQLADKFFGYGRYRVAVRAKTTGRGYSRARARHEDNLEG
jgi:hypothetical protein